MRERGRFDLFFRGSKATFCPVKRHSKTILIVVVMLVALVGAALLAAKRYVESDATRDRLAAALSRALGLTVTLEKVQLALPDGVSLQGVTIPSDSGSFLEKMTVTAHCRLAALLQRRVEINGLRVEKPKIVWRQGADGKWSLPTRGKTESVAPMQPTPPKVEKAERFHVSIDGVELIDGTAEFVDKDQQSVATLTGFRLDYRMRPEGQGEGTLTIERILWGGVPLEKLRSSVKYTDGELTLDPVETLLGGGKLVGSITAQPATRDIPYKAALQFDGTDLGRLMNETGWAPNQFAGQLAGKLEAHGTFRRMVKVEGEGRLMFTGGSIRELEILASLGADLGIPELADLHLQDSIAEFHLGDEKIHVDQLALNSTSLKILATGMVRLNGRIDLGSQLVLTQPVINRLPDSVRTHLVGDTIDFKVAGTMKKPRTDLMDRLFSGKKLTEQFVDVFSTLLNGKDKPEKEKEKKKKSGGSPSATPPPLPPATDPTATTIVPPADPVPSPPPAKP
jgi:hypothetical protein